MSRPPSPSPSSHPALPTCPNGLFNFGPDCVQVSDADEEILELYMHLASTSPEPGIGQRQAAVEAEADSGGLGFLDSTKSILEISLDLTPYPTKSDANGPSQAFSSSVHGSGHGHGRKARGGGKRRTETGTQNLANGSTVLEVRVQQDLGALKGRKGDTGSVLWRSSLHLARHLLTQHSHPPPTPLLPLFNRDKLASARVLELGAGTGLLAVLLSRLCGQYTATDRLENLKLVQRNLEMNGISVGSGAGPGPDAGPVGRSVRLTGGQSSESSSAGPTAHKKGKKDKEPPSSGSGSGSGPTVPAVTVRLEEVDWLVVAEEARARRRPRASPPRSRSTGPSESMDHRYQAEETGSRKGRIAADVDAYDLILAVDCIYNEHLVPALVDTLGHYCPPGSGRVAWVVVELRSADVLTTFLERWLADQWTVVRLDESCMGRWEGKRARWVGWVGWR